MTDKPVRKMFVNLSVRDLKRSMTFFSKLGFQFNPKFTDDNAACMIVSDQAFVMLLTQPFFQGFTRREACDTDELVRTAIAAGGTHAMDPQDHGFMYGWSFYDPDGHHWEVFWMDPKSAQ